MTLLLVFLLSSLSFALIVVVLASELRDHRRTWRRLNAIPHYTLSPAALSYIGLLLRDQYDAPASPTPPHLIALVRQLNDAAVGSARHLESPALLTADANTGASALGV